MRRGRQAWLLGPLAAAAVSLAAGVMVAVPPAFVAAGNAAMEAGRPFRAEDLYSTAMRVPAVDGWVAPFNRGVARYEQEKWDASAEDFERAAIQAPRDQHCMVSLNWAAALESGADALARSDDLHGAGLRYQQALIVLSMTGCPDDRPGRAGSEADDWEEARRRLSGKATDSSASQGEQADQQRPPDADEVLEERIAEAQRERVSDAQKHDPRTGENTGERTW